MGSRRIWTRDGRLRGLLADWDAWMAEAHRLYGRFLDRVGDPPFYYHEVASVGFLAASAALAGFVPLAEYEVVKRGREDKRARVDGRADLWFASDERSYSFEFKRAYASATAGNLRHMLDRASADVACIQRDEYHYAAAGLLAFVRDAGRTATYESFAADGQVDVAYRIGPSGVDGAYLFFRVEPSR